MMNKAITYEEQQLMSLYNTEGTRRGLISALEEMSAYLSEEERELKALTASALQKLKAMGDSGFELRDLIPDFTLEGEAAVSL